jgi:hypothetical protein
MLRGFESHPLRLGAEVREPTRRHNLTFGPKPDILSRHLAQRRRVGREGGWAGNPGTPP